MLNESLGLANGAPLRASLAGLLSSRWSNEHDGGEVLDDWDGFGIAAIHRLHCCETKCLAFSKLGVENSDITLNVGRNLRFFYCKSRRLRQTMEVVAS